MINLNITSMPIEIQAGILSHLANNDDFKSVSLTCRSWNRIVNVEIFNLWKEARLNQINDKLLEIFSTRNEIALPKLRETHGDKVTLKSVQSFFELDEAYAGLFTFMLPQSDKAKFQKAHNGAMVLAKPLFEVKQRVMAQQPRSNTQ